MQKVKNRYKPVRLFANKKDRFRAANRRYMYKLYKIINNDSQPSQIPSVAFYPTGSLVAVAYLHNNQIKIFDTENGELTKRYENPDAQLDHPHGVVVTDNHIIVSNKHDPANKPSTFNVYSLKTSSCRPVNIFNTPLDYLREAHSLSYNKGRLVVTYCNGIKPSVLSYHFDDDTGQISGPIDIVEDCLLDLGKDVKGITFNSSGDKVLVSFVTEKSLTIKYIFLELARYLKDAKGLKRLIQRRIERIYKVFNRPKYTNKKDNNSSNGIAEFLIDEHGKMSSNPIHVRQEEAYCRMENISLVDDLLTVSDPVNNSVKIFSFDEFDSSNKALFEINEGLHFPHDASISKDKTTLAVVNHGIEVLDNHPRWGKFLTPRQDKLHIYRFRSR